MEIDKSLHKYDLIISTNLCMYIHVYKYKYIINEIKEKVRTQIKKIGEEAKER